MQKALLAFLLPKSGVEWSQPWNWQTLFHLAKKHEVFPFFYKAIKKHPDCRSTIPPSLEEEMNILYYRHTARNILLLDRLKKIVEAFKNSNISFILFKGFDLALRVYGDPFLRTQRDLDFIVLPKDFSRAKQILDAMGESSCLDLHSDIVSLKCFEHWSSKPLTIDGLWDRRETILLEGIEIPVLNREDLFLALAIHFGFHHHFRGLKWLIDLIWLASHPELNWSLLKERAKENHLEGILDEVLTRLKLKKRKMALVPVLTCFDVKPLRYLLRLGLLPTWKMRWKMIRETNFLTQLVQDSQNRSRELVR